MGTVARLKSEAYGVPLEFPEDVKKYPLIVQNETQTYQAKRRAIDESVSGLSHSLRLSEEEITKTEPLVAKGLISDLELTKMKRQANDIRVQITERRNKYRADANVELVKTESELAQARENVAGREDVLNRTTIRAPVRGTVKNIRVKTIGGVVQPAVDIMEIVPLDDQLLIEAKIKPKDVAFLRPGLEATVKITAYDYSIYGGLKGKLEHISADTLTEEKRNAMPGEDTYYKVLVRTDSATLKRGNKTFPIIPGMTATVEIRTGEKTILEFLMKPVFKAREAFRER
jgi:adhesin transport system membrane fusion protein